MNALKAEIVLIWAENTDLKIERTSLETELQGVWELNQSYLLRIEELKDTNQTLKSSNQAF